MDMMNVIESDEQLLRATRWAYRFKYGKMEVQIAGLGFARAKLLVIDPIKNTITSRSNQLSSKILKFFGQSISKLNIGYEYIKPNETKRKINEFIGKYCSESLIQLHLWGCTGTELDEIAIPMPKLRRLSFTGGELKNMSKKLTTIFPSLTDLIIDGSVLDGKSFISHHFPNLKHLDVGFTTYGLSEMGIESGLAKNPQIQSLKLHMCPAKFFPIIKKYLPNLESLGLHWPTGNFSNYTELIDFKSVKSLSIVGVPSVRIPLVFDIEKLTEFELVMYTDGLPELWLDFILEYKGIQNLNLGKILIADYQLLRIGEELRDLREFTASGLQIVLSTTLVRFIESKNSLQKATFQRLDRFHRDALTERFQNEWNLSYEDTNFFMKRVKV